jgi:TonB family protein
MRRMKPRLLFVVVLCSALLLAAQTAVPGEVEITAEPGHHLALENEYVRAFKVEVAPRAATLMHRHRHDYVFVTLGPSEVSNEVAGKTPVALKLQDGETRFAPGNFAHVARNLSDKPFRNVTVELMQDEQARKTPPPKWDEERGLNVLNGGTQHILFVQDGVRVSQIELQPGGVIPRHHHAGPHLVVAVTDVEVRSDVEGKGPSTKTLAAGDIAWVPGGFTHTVTNVGKQEVQFVTLEFQAASRDSPASVARPVSNVGTVVVKTDISETGRVLGAWVAKSLDPESDKRALRGIKKWKFEPARKDGKPVRVLALVEVIVSKDGQVSRAKEHD